MRLALISDIHSNLQALRAVLDQIDKENVDEIACLGDIVGYGPDPGVCLELVRDRCASVVLGNHDLAVAREKFEYGLPKDGRKAARHNRKALSASDLEYLASLPLTLVHGSATLVHATPGEPDRWLRLASYQMSQAQFECFETAICFMGHTHRPSVISNRLGVLEVRRGYRYLVNVGSVGQPRDADPRACVGIFDDADFSFRLERISYDIEAAEARYREEKLPRRLASRLAAGK